MNIKNDFILSKINEGYLVGGSVRDFLMNKPFVDRDIAIKNAQSFTQKTAKMFEGTIITLDKEYQIYRVVLKDKINYVDISELQGKTIEEDLTRRDFTINAIAYDLANNIFIDPFSGREDIKKRVIRHINERNFEDDPLRILRAFRFLSVTGFSPADDLEISLKKYLHLIMKPSAERISYEIMKLFGGNFASETLIFMDKCGALERIFPFVGELKQVPPNSHHHLDLFHHVVETVRNIEILYENSPADVKSHLDKIDFGGFPRINHLKLAGFMHDIGKFSTWTIEQDTGRHRFIKHDDAGAKMSIPILKNMKFSKKQIDYISFMIKNHIYPSNVVSAPDLNEKVIMRYIRKTGENVIDNIILAKADRLSAQGPEITKEITDANINGLNSLLRFYLDKKDTLKPLPKLLDGFEVMKIKNIKASPLLGEIINALKEEQLNGNINSKDDAVNFVKNYKMP